MQESTSRADLARTALPEQRIGSYRILERLGAGGMSAVYRAVHVDTGHEVALKILTQSLARNSTVLQRFLREARSVETLEDPYIVAIYDRGIDQGRHYLVLEYVRGGDFHEFIQRRGPLGVADAISVILGVARGLRHAASRGLIHRDVKPSNILRTPEGQPKLTDLGLALQSEFEDERVTREGTTVGTVDYMAPEQARDSRATSIQSDIYSLGCTFYYLLTGVAPYPGGDITDKLTRHARAPVPEIRDLRPDVPPEVSAILRRMMAKEPSDRFADYDELITALEAVPAVAPDGMPAIALAPLRDDEDLDHPVSSGESQAPPPWSGEFSGGPADTDAPLLEPLADLVGELSGQFPRPAPRQPATPLELASAGAAFEDTTDSDIVEESAVVPASRPSRSVAAWIIPSIVIGLVFVLMAIGTHQFRDRSQELEAPPGDISNGDAEVAHASRLHSSPPRTALPRKEESVPTQPVRSRRPASSEEADRTRWVEPADPEPVAAVSASAEDRHHLPDWARAPIADRVDGPFVVVRRIPDRNDAEAVPSLEMALDRNRGGTVELADEGPLPVDELRVSGRSRLIRARPGFRPIVQIERPSLETVRQQTARQRVAGPQTAFVALDRKSLTLDGLDLILDASLLSSGQTALFGCAGANLTLRNCTITILNNQRTAFSVIRVEPSAQPSRIRLEGTLVRGWFTSGVEISGTSADLAVYRSLLLGGTGPLVRVALPESDSPQRLDFVDAVLAGPGPIIECAQATHGAQPKPLVMRSFGSAFGRLQVPAIAIASVIWSSRPGTTAAQQIEWLGDRNLFAGWRGFLAIGRDPTITVGDLAAVRSTWNGTDGASQEILVPYLLPADPAAALPMNLVPFLPDRAAILGQVARPRAGLFEKTVSAYASPIRPEPVGWAVDRRTQPRPPVQAKLVPPPSQAGSDVVIIPPKAASPGASPPTDGRNELTMDVADPHWAGDLGAFLRDRLTAEMGFARVRVVGTGMHRFTPVRLPPGLQVEIRVEPTAGAGPPSWSPQPQVTGPALIEVRGGALVLAGVDLRHDAESRLENLIAAEDAHLVLVRCQLTAPPGSTDVAGGLIAFRALTTRPKSGDAHQRLFTVPVDRPVCRLVESTLIAHGTALRAELGRGLVALSQCAVGAGGAVLELVPARVMRSRFDVDLLLDQCTMVAERSIIRLGPWPGQAPGPDRPWLVTSQNCAFLDLSPRRPRETALLRGDADALARGTLFWQALNDAIDVDQFTAADGGPASTGHSPWRDVLAQWVHFWGPSHMSRIAGPYGSRRLPSVRLLDRPHPGRIEPADLILDRDYHPGRDRLDVGADLARQGIVPRSARPGVRRP